MDTRKPPGNRAAFFFRENSSNGGKDHQNFLAKYYGPEKGVSREFSDDKCIIINNLIIYSEKPQNDTFCHLLWGYVWKNQKNEWVSQLGKKKTRLVAPLGT